jgi:hypothetical protein
MFRKKILPLFSGLKNKQRKLGSTRLCLWLDEKVEGPRRVSSFPSLKNILHEYYIELCPGFDLNFMYITFRELDLLPSSGVRGKISN